MLCSVVPANLGLCHFTTTKGSAGGLLDFEFVAFFNFGKNVICDGEVESREGVLCFSQPVTADVIAHVGETIC